MQAIQHSADTRRAVSEPQSFPPLELVNRPTVPTEQAAYYLNRKPQTLRGRACCETGPQGLRPFRIHGYQRLLVVLLHGLRGGVVNKHGFS